MGGVVVIDEYSRDVTDELVVKETMKELGINNFVVDSCFAR